MTPGSMNPTVVINVVGLSASLLPHAPRIRALGVVRQLQPVLPAVTCSVQASMLTGTTPGNHDNFRGHGIVGNGWYFRELGEVRFWNRSNKLVQAEQVWDTARRRDASFTCMNLFWWHNCWSSCDYVVQARPIYKADGRKLPDCYTQPPEFRHHLQRDPPEGLGTFPLFRFWGPMADITSSRWIADAARLCGTSTTLTLVYLPHLDYPLQKLGPDHPDIPRHVCDIDNVVGDLMDGFRECGYRVLLVSEYGIESTTGQEAIAVNRTLNWKGLLGVRHEDGREVLDPAGGAAFVVADHQIAHLYINDPRRRDEVMHVVQDVKGIASMTRIEHDRAGDVVLIAEPGRWFTYDWWRVPEHAPDFARTVDIHRKPGYDPRELFGGPAIEVLWKLFKRKLGFRTLLDVVPLDTTLVRGTHGRTDMPDALQPLMIGPQALIGSGGPMPCTAVRDVILRALFD